MISVDYYLWFVLNAHLLSKENHHNIYNKTDQSTIYWENQILRWLIMNKIH